MIELLPLEGKDLPQFKADMQEAFKLGAAGEYPELKEEILPEADINGSLSRKGAQALKAVLDGKIVGGAIVVLEETQGHLDFLYVKHGVQSRGIGKQIWYGIEKLYPQIKVWKTCTPYFEKRNIHFYINVCKFKADEFFNDHHKDPHIPEDMLGGDYFFSFEKIMN